MTEFFSSFPRRLLKISRNSVKGKEGRTNLFLLCIKANRGSVESTTFVIDKEPWVSFREAADAIVALLGACFIFDLQYSGECSGAP